MSDLDFTHDPAARSWVDTANDPATDFPLQNLPFGTFVSEDGAATRIGVAVGDRVLDLNAVAGAGLLPGMEALSNSSLRDVMAGNLGGAIRGALFRLLSENVDEGLRAGVEPHLLALSEVVLCAPVMPGDFTDFYASIHHATRVGQLFRPDNPLLPNYRWIPIGYHGRASSVVPSGTPVRRPVGQLRPGSEGEAPRVAASERLDYELEVGAFIAGENDLGVPVPLGHAEDRLFGLCLVNDWSARDIQGWEYQPLGPFLGKSFATSVAPWVVTREALVPFRVAAAERGAEAPSPLPYLRADADRARGGIDLHLEVGLRTPEMRERGEEAMRLTRGNARDLYWTFAQMITHHASNGCNLRPGDLLASGTVSGPERDASGCLLELTTGGREPLTLPSGESRTFLEDGDEVVLSGHCERDGFRRIGFGACSGTIVPAPPAP